MTANEHNPESFFASAGRASAHQLHQEIELISVNPIINTVMEIVSGLLCVLNEQRQILAVNHVLLQAMDLDESALGLRFGEAVDCIHAHDHPGGCGTSQACLSCGAAIAMVISLESGETAQRQCCLTIDRDGQLTDYFFKVRCSPIMLDGPRFLVLFLQDVTTEQKQAALEHVFFHDINNLIASLRLSAHYLSKVELTNGSGHTQIERIKQIISRLSKEVDIQRILNYGGRTEYQLYPEAVEVAKALQGVKEALTDHAANSGKTLNFPSAVTDLHITTDRSLLERILTNMIINALEATHEGGEVRVWVEHSEQDVTFCVWNSSAISATIATRIFQRNFSTKQGVGRGLGTYIMKLFGETYLGGTVDFTTSKAEGTVFRFRLPLL